MTELVTSGPPSTLLWSALSFALVLWGCSGLVRLAGHTPTVGSSILTLFVLSAALAPLAILSPGSLRPIGLIVLSLGLLASVLGQLKSNANKADHPSTPLLRQKQSYLGLVLGIAFSWRFAGSNYVFEGHDLLYFGWVPNLWGSGSSAVGFAWPLEMAASNTLAGTATGLASIFLLDVTLHQLIDARFLIILVASVHVIYWVLRSASKVAVISLLSISGAAAIWSADIAYELLISSFPAVILLAIMAVKAVREPDQDQEELGVWILLIVGLTKALLLPLAVLTMLTYFIISRKLPSSSTIWMGGSILAVNLLGWAVAPKSGDGADVTFSLAGFGVRFDSPVGPAELMVKPLEWLDSFSQFPGWNLDLFSIFVLREHLAGGLLTATILCWALFRTTAVFFLIRGQVLEPGKPLTRLIDLWVIWSTVSLLFIRNAESVEIKHQAHAYLLLSAVLFPLATIAVARRLQNLEWHRFGAGFAILGATALLLVSSTAATNAVSGRVLKPSPSAVSWAEVSAHDQSLESRNGFLLAPDIPYPKAQVIASMLGLKYWHNPEGGSSIDSWLVPSDTAGLRDP